MDLVSKFGIDFGPIESIKNHEAQTLQRNVDRVVNKLEKVFGVSITDLSTAEAWASVFIAGIYKAFNLNPGDPEEPYYPGFAHAALAIATAQEKSRLFHGPDAPIHLTAEKERLHLPLESGTSVEPGSIQVKVQTVPDFLDGLTDGERKKEKPVDRAVIKLMRTFQHFIGTYGWTPIWLMPDASMVPVFDFLGDLAQTHGKSAVPRVTQGLRFLGTLRERADAHAWLKSFLIVLSLDAPFVEENFGFESLRQVLGLAHPDQAKAFLQKAQELSPGFRADFAWDYLKFEEKDELHLIYEKAALAFWKDKTARIPMNKGARAAIKALTSSSEEAKEVLRKADKAFYQAILLSDGLVKESSEDLVTRDAFYAALESVAAENQPDTDKKILDALRFESANAQEPIFPSAPQDPHGKRLLSLIRLIVTRRPEYAHTAARFLRTGRNDPKGMDATNTNELLAVLKLIADNAKNEKTYAYVLGTAETLSVEGEGTTEQDKMYVEIAKLAIPQLDPGILRPAVHRTYTKEDDPQNLRHRNRDAVAPLFWARLIQLDKDPALRKQYKVLINGEKHPVSDRFWSYQAQKARESLENAGFPKPESE